MKKHSVGKRKEMEEEKWKREEKKANSLTAKLLSLIYPHLTVLVRYRAKTNSQF